MYGIPIPGWNSLESVQNIHGTLELLAIILFGLLVFVDILEHAAKEQHRKERLTILGFWVFALAVLMELVAYPYSRRADRLSNEQIGSDEQLISKMHGEVAATNLNALQAAESAKRAEGSAKIAKSLAQGARKEANSFEKDIVSAKEQAAKAESDLTGALRQAAEARAELNRLETPRQLTNTDWIVQTLSAYSGTKYMFSSCFANKESEDLLVGIDEILQRARWVRVPQPKPSSFPILITISIPLSDGTILKVAPGTETGVTVTVEAKESITDLNSLPFSQKPANVRAAAALIDAIFWKLLPFKPIPTVHIGKGDSKVVIIDVGSKM